MFENTYDSVGRITESAVSSYDGPDSAAYGEGTWRYHYDTDGKLIRKTYTEEDEERFKYLYSYNEDGTLQIEALYENSVLMYRRSFIYNSAGDLMKESFCTTGGFEYCSYEYLYSE